MTVYCNIPVQRIFNLYIVIPYLLVLFLFFYYLCICPVTVILLHCGSPCHENKFLVCVNIHLNKKKERERLKLSALNCI